MKFLLFFFLFLLRRGASKSLRHSSEKDGRNLFIAWGDPDGCLEVKDGFVDIGNSFTLGDCSIREYGVDMVYLNTTAERKLFAMPITTLL